MNIDFNSWHPNQVHYENFRCRKLLGDEDFKKVKMPKNLLFEAQKWTCWQWSTIYRHSVDQKTYRACLWWWGRIQNLTKIIFECHDVIDAMMPWCHDAMMHHWCRPRWERRRKLNTSESLFELRPKWVKCSIGRSVRIGRCLFLFVCFYQFLWRD